MLLCLLALDYTMMYLMRGSMREGKVAPGLWGPWTITDFSGWSDQMTLDYNFECVVCHRQSLSIRRLDNHTPRLTEISHLALTPSLLSDGYAILVLYAWRRS